MGAADVLNVAAEDRRLEALGADEVVGHQQEPGVGEPAVAGDEVGELVPGAGGDVAVEQRVQHGHEVALAGAERAVQVAGLGALLGQRGADQAECLVEGHPQLRGDDVGVEGGLPALHPFGQPQDEVALVHPLGDGDQFAQQRLGDPRLRARHCARSLRRLLLRTVVPSSTAVFVAAVPFDPTQLFLTMLGPPSASRRNRS